MRAHQPSTMVSISLYIAAMPRRQLTIEGVSKLPVEPLDTPAPDLQPDGNPSDHQVNDVNHQTQRYSNEEEATKKLKIETVVPINRIDLVQEKGLIMGKSKVDLTLDDIKRLFELSELIFRIGQGFAGGYHSEPGLRPP